MIVDIMVPELGESISEVEIGEWLVEIGSRVETDAALVELESDKATVELPTPRAGVLVEVLKKQGETAAVGEVIARIETNGEVKEIPPADREEDVEKGALKKRDSESKRREIGRVDEQTADQEFRVRESPHGDV